MMREGATHTRVEEQAPRPHLRVAAPGAPGETFGVARAVIVRSGPPIETARDRRARVHGGGGSVITTPRELAAPEDRSVLTIF